MGAPILSAGVVGRTVIGLRARQFCRQQIDGSAVVHLVEGVARVPEHQLDNSPTRVDWQEVGMHAYVNQQVVAAHQSQLMAEAREARLARAATDGQPRWPHVALSGGRRFAIAATAAAVAVTFGAQLVLGAG